MGESDSIHTLWLSSLLSRIPYSVAIEIFCGFYFPPLLSARLEMSSQFKFIPKKGEGKKKEEERN